MKVAILDDAEYKRLQTEVIEGLIGRMEKLTREVFWPGIKADLLRRIEEVAAERSPSSTPT